MATTLHMKIHDYQSDGGHLLVSFCTDDSKNPVEEYPIYSFQPHDFGVDSIDQIIPLLGQRGLDIAQRQDAKEAMQSDTGKMVDLQDLVGTTHSLDIASIATQQVTTSSEITDLIIT
jgi:hypothetical protein